MSELEDAQMKYEDVRSALQRFSYKPNFACEVTPGTDVSGVLVHFLMYVPDSRRHHPPIQHEVRCDRYDLVTAEYYRQDLDLIPVQATYAVPEFVTDEDRFWAWLRESILLMETHEIDEWFQVDGKLLADPHKTLW